MNTPTLPSMAPGWWTTHGTKILGIVAAVVGAAGEYLNLIQTLDPKRAALWGLVIGLGGAIVKRGFTNQQSIEQNLTSRGWTPPTSPPR